MQRVHLYCCFACPARLVTSSSATTAWVGIKSCFAITTFTKPDHVVCLRTYCGVLNQDGKAGLPPLMQHNMLVYTSCCCYCSTCTWLRQPHKLRSPASCYADDQRRTPILPESSFLYCLPHYLVHLLIRPRTLDVSHLKREVCLLCNVIV
jgi:hypothetical protein